MNYIFIGFKGCGKTYLGRLLAKRLHMPFIDSDHLIEMHYLDQFHESLTCRQIYKKMDGAFFRNLERECISSLANVKDSLIAVGGGTVADDENIKMLKKIGVLIYLKLDKETLKKRTLEKITPAYLDEENPEKSFEVMYKKRKPIYEKIASIEIDISDKSEEEILIQLEKIIYGK